MNKIAVVGTGYVGLVTGTCFAETGNQVTCIDIDEAKVNQMKNGIVPFYEPGLEFLFKKNISSGNLKFTESLEDGIKDAEVIFLALPTPPEEDGSADLSYVLGVANEIGKFIQNYKVVVNKSTVPVGTSEKVYSSINKNAKVDFSVVSNPEFLRQGQAVNDFMNPDRIVVGCSDARAKNILNKLYKPFVDSGSKIYFMDEKSSELTSKVLLFIAVLSLSSFLADTTEWVSVLHGSSNAYKYTVIITVLSMLLGGTILVLLYILIRKTIVNKKLK